MTLKKAYLYLVSIIAMIIMVVGGIMLINLALKAWVFKQADQYASYPCAVQPVAPDGKSAGCDQAAIAAQQKVDAQNRSSQRQQEAAQSIAMILVATPVWWYHWKMAKKEA